jgi:endonuclease/exonuclease/phosphatase family metal-dependent hydrolase
MGFYLMQPYGDNNRDSARLALKNWILNFDADIKCIQEFANIPTSKEFNVLDQLKKRGLYFALSSDDPDHHRHWRVGTIIISKYPILKHGDILVSENRFNRIAYADLKVNADTIRIVNLHLESMGIRIANPADMTDPEIAKSQAYTILRKLKVGVFERSKQIRELSEFIEQSPYRVICVGDFNDIPYSYNYRRMKKRMKNAFEESGKGFGFTYNGGTLKTLRIDNQFYSSGVRSIGFETLNTIDFSDHFPLRGEYLIEKVD